MPNKHEVFYALVQHTQCHSEDTNEPRPLKDNWTTETAELSAWMNSLHRNQWGGLNAGEMELEWEFDVCIWL